MARRLPTWQSDPTRMPSRPGHESAPQNSDAARQSATSPADVRFVFPLGDSAWPIGLFLLVGTVFACALRHDFLTYDDTAYVVNNAHVNTGLTWANLKWALTSWQASNWHPATWWSHMLDCELFGLAPWGHHLTSLLLHALNTALLFVVLRAATGARWRSLIVAALFGLHPLHVESVAWIAERKDVLSTFFWIPTIWAYVQWVRASAAGRRSALLFYGLALLLFALGLMSKPMVVTLPCVLLLMDFWPLGRWTRGPNGWPWGVLAEKLPFLAGSAASCVVTLLAQNHGDAVKSLEDFSWSARCANAVLAYTQYLGKTVWPVHLAVLYPNFGDRPPLGPTLLAGALLAAITAAAIVLRRRQPALLVGWLWFVGTLIPVIGLVQVGGQTMADRYSYVPLIGIFIAATWVVADWAAPRIPRAALAGIAGTVVAACGALTVRQLQFWPDSIKLFRHTLAVTENNWMAHYNLAVAYSQKPDGAASARAEFQAMLRIIAATAELHRQRGLALARDPARRAEAIAELRKAIRIKEDEPAPHNDLGRLLAERIESLTEAMEEFRLALKFNPDFAEARANLGAALLHQPGRENEGIAQLQVALILKPELVEAHAQLAQAFAQKPERATDAIAEYEAVLRLDPRSAPAEAGLGLLLAKIPERQPEARRHLAAALRIDPSMTEARRTLEQLGSGH